MIFGVELICVLIPSVLRLQSDVDITEEQDLTRVRHHSFYTQCQREQDQPEEIQQI